MGEVRIFRANVYRYRQSSTQAVIRHHLGLYISGIEHMRVWLPDGKLLFDRDDDIGPLLSLRLPGMKSDFRFNDKRENWVIQMDMPELGYDSETHLPVWERNGYRFPLPFDLAVSGEELPALRHQFARIHRLLDSNLPRNIAAAEIETVAVMSRFLADVPSAAPESAVEKYRRLIDEDRNFEHSLGELALRSGYSQAHLRRQFRRHYLIDPAEYRTGRRLCRIMELISHTVHTPKEIADMTGMKNVTHLYSLLKKHYQATPGQLLRQYRGSVAPQKHIE